MKKIIFIAAALCFFAAVAQAQNFKKTQQQQEAGIKAAKKKGRISEREYQKLMEEQSIIKNTIERAELDGTWTPKEKNQVHDKLQRASKRLRRYQNNGEVY